MNTKRPTIRDVARVAEVAPTTVSRVINNKGYISDETRQRVESAIAELNYIPNSLSQSLRYQKTDTIALLVSDITNPFWTTFARGVEDACQERNLHVILCNTDEKNDKLANYVQMLLQRQTDGFLLVPTGKNSASIVRQIIQKHVPIVVVDRQVDQIDVDIVRGESEQGAYLLTNHLLELGHRKIAILTGSIDIDTSRKRVAGYKRAMQAWQLAIDDDLIRYGEFTPESGYDMTQEILSEFSPRPTAILAAQNFIAIGAIRALNQANIKIPEDMSLVSIDDLPFYTQTEPFLTVAAQNPYLMGQRAADLLISRIEKNAPDEIEEVVLPISFIERKSTAPL